MEREELVEGGEAGEIVDKPPPPLVTKAATQVEKPV